ncbi:MFS multidrug transporter [Pseudovirgaria hyperparasitica]|uniref:MFS multidrug transporter n=1 Tax=Pseudovirgaria hyperparasitica TaxID=470096 RepID=A0A6A6W016_9PEZI|nr:MFS multidrug transporter [Pseudovirgaria hyperparasitica]KAF2755489.1 MFS multidrug transporter [Pseudovirgaria hyperparasitica]
MREEEETSSSSSRDQEKQLGLKSTYIDDSSLAHLPQEHRDYLLQRHGTLALDPMPSMDPADPYNWPGWKKTANLILVAVHAMMTTFTAAAIIPAFEIIAEDLDVSLVKASYLTSMQIAVLGFGPLLWKPISNRYGRRPVWLVSVALSGICNVGCAVSPNYAAMAACRCLVAFFICPAIAIGSGVVVETFFKKDRGRFMGVWTLMVTLGPPAGPFFMGFVAEHIGYRWIYWVLAITNLVQLLLYIPFGPETRYMRVSHTPTTTKPNPKPSPFKAQYLSILTRIDPTPLTALEFLHPLSLAAYPSILIPTLSYTFVFGFASVYLTVEIPQIFIPKFALSPQGLGLQFLGIVVGSVVGEQLAGPLSDWWMNRNRNRDGSEQSSARPRPRPRPEHRLYLSYLGFLLAIVGLVVFGVRTEQAAKGHWNVTPIVGIAVAAAGNQIVTTVLVTYAVDCHGEHSSSIGVFVNVVRSTWGFIGPFWFPDMITKLGVGASGGLMAGIVFVVGWLPVLVLQWRGGRWRARRVEKEG